MTHKLQVVKGTTLLSGLVSSRNSIPSSQCALGTTPHLSIQKKAREGQQMEGEGEKKEERQEGKCQGKDSRRCEGCGEEKRETQR